MNPSAYEQPGLSLPEPVAPEMPVVAPDETLRAKSPELHTQPVVPQITSTNDGSMNPLIAITPAQTTSYPQPPASSATTHTDVPPVADDADLIEKEWVNKAKAIVAKTKEDPHEQAQEISYFKADYLKKRYNKEIKVNES